MGVHDGHRARVRQRVLREGLTQLPVHNALEVILFFALPRGDTNELAHRILERYHGDLAAVTEAPFEDLLTIEGVGENTAFLLKMIPQIAAVYRTARVRDGLALDSMEALREYFVPMFYGKHDEELHLICLDAALHPLHDALISQGSTNATPVHIKRIVEAAVTHHAARVMLAHNHPGGSPRPSMRDESATRAVVTALKPLEVEVTDHIIVAGEGLFSFHENGILPFVQY